MKILSWNINGIRAGERKGIFDWVKEYSPDIICFQETKAHPNQLDAKILNLDGYHSYWDSAERKGYSGVATYSKKEPIQVSTGLGLAEFDAEGRLLETEFEDFVLLNVYFPNGKKDAQRLQYKLDFYKAFLKFILRKRAEGKKVIFCGDVNTAHKPIDLARPEANRKISGFLPIECKWLDQVIEAKFIDTLREFHSEPNLYSWWDLKTGARQRNIGWRIDYFFIDQALKSKLKDAFILPEIEGSDHCPVGVEMI